MKNVLENIVLPIHLDDGEIDDDYLNEIINLLGLEEKKNSFIYELSGGQQQRVALARALASKPAIIFADEPTGNLDAKSSKEVVDLLKIAQRKYHETVILVTHDISEAILFSNRIFFLSKDPASVILEFNNSNNQSFEIKQIDEIKNSIFEKYPNILKGKI